MNASLFIIGTPLDDTSPLSRESIGFIQEAKLVFAESRKRTMGLIKRSGGNPEDDRFIFLDRPPPHSLVEATLRKVWEGGETAVLLSDTGMPILFDPGREILETALQIGFQIRTAPSATSWSTACAVSGLPPPFLVYGFLPQKSSERLSALRAISPLREHTVLLETPYRFQLLLNEAMSVFGPRQGAFLAWEIARPGERYLWGSLRRILNTASASLPKKGEFVLILHKNL